MLKNLNKKNMRLPLKIISVFLVCFFLFSIIVPPGFAQMLNLPTPGAVVNLSSVFSPTILKGMTLYTNDPFRFDFIVDSGNSNLSGEELRKESKRLVNYFLASMTVPKNDLWVNLSPVEKDRIIPDALGKTELGQNLLAQDYLLKQLTATLMHPEGELGKKFWEKIYQEAKTKFGTMDIPTDTFNKVWIMPESATIYEHGATVYIMEAKLKVMLEEEYEALSRSAEPLAVAKDKISRSQISKDNKKLPADNSKLTTSIIKQIILPAIEKEVNEGENFAPLRQIYYSLILAKWYKEKIRDSILSKVYIDKNKVAGIDQNNSKAKEEIYGRYLDAYQKGVYNYMKEEYDAVNKQIIPKKYFSGGFVDKDFAMAVVSSEKVRTALENTGSQSILQVAISPEGSDNALITAQEEEILLEKLQARADAVRNKSAFFSAFTLDRQKDLLEKVKEFYLQGYDFDIAYMPEKAHEVTENFTKENQGFISQIVIDQFEEIEIVRGEKLSEFSHNLFFTNIINKTFRQEFLEKVTLGKATYSMLKPDAFELKMTEEIIGFIEERGFKVSLGPSFRMTKEQAEKFYKVHEGKRFFNDLVSYIIRGEVLPLFIEETIPSGNAVEKFREVIDAVREHFNGDPKGENRIHGSDSIENALIETKNIFSFYDKAMVSNIDSNEEGRIKTLSHRYSALNHTLTDLQKKENLLSKMVDKKREAKTIGKRIEEIKKKMRELDRVLQKDIYHFSGRHSYGEESSETIYANAHQSSGDRAMITKKQEVGGIDLNEINLKNKSEGGFQFEFNPDVMKKFENIQVEGFSPIIINIKPIQNIFSLLGLKEEEQKTNLVKS